MRHGTVQFKKQFIHMESIVCFTSMINIISISFSLSVSFRLSLCLRLSFCVTESQSPSLHLSFSMCLPACLSVCCAQRERYCDTQNHVHKELSTVTYRDCDTKSMVHNGHVTYWTLWNTGHVTQRADPVKIINKHHQKIKKKIHI